MAEEKNLTLSIEEMKNAVSMATFLPDILKIIQEMNNKINHLNDNFVKQATALNNVTTTISSIFERLESKIKEFDENQTNFKQNIESLDKEILDLKKAIGDLKNKVNDIRFADNKNKEVVNKPNNIVNEQPKTQNQGTKPNKERNQNSSKKEYSQKQKTFLNAMNSVIKNFSGKKKMLVSRFNLKKQYNEEIANLIIDCFVKNGCYDKSTSVANILSQDKIDRYIKTIKD